MAPQSNVGTAAAQRPPSFRRTNSGSHPAASSGRDHCLGPHGAKASKHEYDRLIGEWLTSGRQPLLSSQDDIIFVELCARYLEHARSYYIRDGKSTGEVPGIKSAMKLLSRLYGRQTASEFGPLALKSLRERWVADGWSRPFVNIQTARSKRMFKWGVSEQLVLPATFQAIASVAGLRRGKKEARETDPVLPVDDDTVGATLPHLPQIVADIVRLQRFTGMRPAELCILRPCDLDRDADVWAYIPSQHKTEHHGRKRTILIGPKAQEVLLHYLARDSETYCFRPCDSEAKRRAEQHASRKTPMSYGTRPGTNRKRKPKNPSGDCYTTNSYRRAIHRACDRAFPHPALAPVKAADLTDQLRAELNKWQSDHRWSPNRLRHTAAAEIRREFGLEAAQVVLGRSQANVTQIYAERDLAKGVEVARQIGQLNLDLCGASRTRMSYCAGSGALKNKRSDAPSAGRLKSPGVPRPPSFLPTTPGSRALAGGCWRAMFGGRGFEIGGLRHANTWRGD